MENNYVYPYSFNTAKSDHELELWRESLKENEACRKAIEKTINENYNGYHLNDDTALKIIKEFGYDRVNWVLAATIQQRVPDGRFSYDNVEWAKGFYIPDQKSFDINPVDRYTVTTHPAILDGFVRQARQAYQALGLYEAVHCMEDCSGLDYTGKVLVLKPTLLKDEYKSSQYQLVLAQSGFGCSPSARGRKVYGVFLTDGERCQYNRHDFYGVLKEELLTNWARKKLEMLEAQASTQTPEQTENQGQDNGITPSL